MGEPKEGELKLPGATKVDTAHTLVKAGISAIPVIGGPAAELFSLVIVPPLERRRVEWMNSVAQRLMELEKKVDGFKVENLRDNQLFVTVVVHATVVALRNHQKEKLEALQNAVVNCALRINIEEDLQLMFLDLIDSLTPLHLRIITYFDNPSKWLKDHGVKLSIVMGGASDGLEVGLPELKGQRDIYDPIVQDLFNRGLLSADKTVLHGTMDETGITESRTTVLGKKFLEYLFVK